MIIVKLQGGLGNQLFQWAVGDTLAKKYNTELYFDTSYFETSQNGVVSKWDMDISKFISVNSISGKHLRVITDNFHYQDIDNDDIFLDGYWQTEKYFIDNEIDIRETLKMSDFERDIILEKYPVLKEDNTISIHVRRGDYLNLKNVYPILNIDYYNKALSEINIKDAKLIILSNDIEWCKENFKFENMTFIENESNINDLFIMSLCKNNIIANSSFSWWGAWLNDNPNKKVVAPSIWFMPSANIYTGDIIPEKWIKI